MYLGGHIWAYEIIYYVYINENDAIINILLFQNSDSISKANFKRLSRNICVQFLIY